jgi:hypothetical protein
MAALRGQRPDRIPFLNDIGAAYPPGAAERDLRNRGMGLCQWRRSFSQHTPHVETKAIHYEEAGRKMVRTIHRTPHGELTSLEESSEHTSWAHEHVFKSPEDYRKLLFMIEDTVVEPRYDNTSRAISEAGDDVLMVEWTGLGPFSQLIYRHMGTETFCYEWADHRDEILKLYRALEGLMSRILRIAAKSPCEVVLHDANCNSQIVSPENFAKFYKPGYEESVELMHRHGKLIGTHLDADNGPYMELIGSIGLDYINAYDLTFSPPIAAARKAWPGKALWLNFPCAWHVLPPEEIRSRTAQMLTEAEPGNGLIVGITETVPPERVVQNFTAIMDGIDSYEDGRRPTTRARP